MCLNLHGSYSELALKYVIWRIEILARLWTFCTKETQRGQIGMFMTSQKSTIRGTLNSINYLQNLKMA